MIRPVATLPGRERDRLRSAEVHVDGYFGDEPEPAGQSGPGPRGPWWFIVAEVVLILAVPLLGLAGVRALLHSDAGVFVAQPQPGEPRWRALVDPSPVMAVAEVLDGRPTGIVLLTQPGERAPGGAVVVVPTMLRTADGRPLADRPVEEAIEALSRELRLAFTETVVVDAAGWAEILGPARYRVDNPDPIPATETTPPLAVGLLEVDATTVAAFLGAAEPDADPRSVVFRRSLFWEALVAAPPAGDHPVARVLSQIAAGEARVVPLPVNSTGLGLTIRPEEAEALINEVVPLPSGSRPGDRLLIRVLDRTGELDTAALAVALGRRGYEVTEVANAAVFGPGGTQLIVPSHRSHDVVRDLAAELGAVLVSPDPLDERDDDVIVLVAGSDLVLE